MLATETKSDAGHGTAPKALALGEAVATAEAKAIDLGTNRIYRLRVRHPYLFGVAAFILGAAIISIFTMTTYKNWAYEGVNLTTAVYQVVLGSLGGGIASVVLAFVYAGSVGRTRKSMQSAGISQTPRKSFV